MTADDLVALLGDHWPRTLAALGPDEREELAVLLQGLAGAADPRAVRAALRRLRRLLRALPDEHPVTRALRDGVRFADAPDASEVDRAPVLALLATLHAPPTPDPVHARLLAAPALAADDVAAAPGEPGLIRLRHPELGDRYPRFQFVSGTTRPLDVVGRINRLLMADRDPWGAADWWLGGNRWLGGVPAELLGSVPDEELTRAARELVEGD
ncbi:hypothetical protein [Streptomyces albireticuli]|uniref:Uncharacterized protein n=1 Tax=Streptomyces albireticuli TaxID=1940 RepID=A0A2A2D292_9ACTN|nr:hypothetical protein [Streptomyces albireticuli]MCD9195277.1 hypothetical protein [Streptomyces albireticuli]PAU45536.1 hypothetical protein CK936_28900 [Streptomyces albireticuli]